MGNLPADHGGDRSVPAALFTLIGPRTAALVGSCIAVLTAHTLGLEFLASRFLFLPMGMWVVALVMLIAEYRHQCGRSSPGLSEQESARRVQISKLNLRTVNLAAMKAVWPRGADAVGGVLELVGVPAGSLGQARRALNNLGSKVAPENTTLRIGVDLADADARELIAYGLREENLGVQVEWCKARAGLVTDVEQDMAAAGLDVLVRRERRGDLNVFVAEQPDHPAAWPEWGTPLPLSYAGVFPPRIDPSRVVLSGCDLQQAPHAELAARMTIACAMLARIPGRAGVGRSAVGRMLAGRPFGGAMPRLLDEDGPLASIMRRIGHSLEAFARGGALPACPPGFVRAAARACAAHLCGSESRTPSDATAATVALAGRLTGDEPESLLRVAAAQIADGRAEDARCTLLRACTTLRTAERRCDTDPLPFIMSEVEVGAPGRMALGRVASGIALAWATAPRESVDYLREDLFDDLSHAGWLRDRPADAEMLGGVIETLAGGASARARAA